MLSPWNAYEKGNSLEKPAVQSPDRITPLYSRLRSSLGTAGLQGATLIRLCLSSGTTVPEDAMEWRNTGAAHHFFNWDLLKVHACFREPLGVFRGFFCNCIAVQLVSLPITVTLSTFQVLFQRITPTNPPTRKTPMQRQLPTEWKLQLYKGKKLKVFNWIEHFIFICKYETRTIF